MNREAFLGVLVTAALLVARPSAAGPGQGTGRNQSSSAAEPVSVGVATAEGPAPAWTWRVVTAAPRIGQDLRAIAVDPSDPQRLYMGTEEGTVLRSFDGGSTWTETDLSPFLLRRSPPPPQPPGGEARDPTEVMVPMVIAWNMLPFNLWPTSRVLKPRQLYVDNPFRPGLYVFPWGTRQGESLLSVVTEGVVTPVSPVRRIVVCPGAEFSVVVATRRDLYGSQDGGETFVRLFGLTSENGSIAMASCSPDHPGEILVASSDGLYESHDGGVSFDPVLYGMPGSGADAVAYAAPRGGKSHVVYSAEGSVLWVVDLDAPTKAKRTYPFVASPFSKTRWIATSANGAIWLATDRGIRMSEDEGKNWVTVAADQFEDRDWWQIVVGPNESGGERIAIERDHFIYASDDGGRTFYQWFSGATNREMRYIVVGVPSSPGATPPWWLLTAGELWSDSPQRRGLAPGGEALAQGQWAARRLSRIPPPAAVLGVALHRLALDSVAVGSAVDRMTERSWLPRIDLQLTFGSGARDSSGEGVISNRYDALYASQADWYEARATATWFLPDLVYPATDSPAHARKALYVQRQRVTYALQDAYRERALRLQQLSGDALDDAQAMLVRARVDALDAMLAAWSSGEPSDRETARGDRP
jgi:photosystem II stability/assembly factor-like uncharacterized protein